MFFPMLRRQAKWVFVLLALVFAGGFVFFGVGSGQGGLGDVLQGWIGNGSSAGGPSISKLESKTRANPKDAAAFRDLVTAYEADRRTEDAIQALERYTALRPKDSDALQELAGLYQNRLQDLSLEYQVAQSSSPASSADLRPPASTAFGQAYTDTNALGDPISQATTAVTANKLSEISQKLQTVSSKQYATYKKLVKLEPADPTLQLQLAQSAQINGDNQGAIAAYKRFLKLSPDDPLVPQVKDQLKQLQPASSSGSKGKQGKTGGG